MQYATEDLKMDECHALLPTDAVWKERVTELIPAHLFSLFLVHKVADPAMYFVTWIDSTVSARLILWPRTLPRYSSHPRKLMRRRNFGSEEMIANQKSFDDYSRLLTHLQ